MIQAVIFDLDGVIIESEPLWKETEKKVFATVGLQLTTEMCRQTVGLDTNDTIAYWYARKPWNGKTVLQLYKEIINEMVFALKKKVELKEGFLQVLTFFTQQSIPVAVASSSPPIIINTALDKFRLRKKFQVICSSEKEKYGKPHPAVYLLAAKRLNIKPQHCLVFEDSFNGLIAAKAAQMKVVTIPDTADFSDKRFDISDIKLSSLMEFDTTKFDLLNKL
jgi:sugar-phosphatase